MFRKVLVPLDGSKEAERVLILLREEGSLEGEVFLLHVIPPGKTITAGGYILDASQEEQGERARFLSYLQDVMHRYGGVPSRWKCEVTVNRTVVGGILESALRDGVDAIAMYTHDRKGLARMLRGSIAADVAKRAPISVRVFKPQELARVA